jgi:hypothetical protein
MFEVGDRRVNPLVGEHARGDRPEAPARTGDQRDAIA